MSRPLRPLIWPDAVLELQDLLDDLETPLYIVGGAVRDAYLHRPVKDLDLAVPAKSVEIARTIANRAKGDIFVMDAEREVARVFINTAEGRLTIDLARFRGADLEADLRDRDFTINAMAVDLRGDLHDLIDPLRAEQDIAARLIRRCAAHAIAADPVRALRAIRQSVQLNFRIERETLADIRHYGPQMTQTSDERIRDEFWNLLAVPRPASALRILHSLGLLQIIVPEAALLEKAVWEDTLITLEHLRTIITSISPLRTDDTAASFYMGMLVMQLDRYRQRLQDHLAKSWPNERGHSVLLLLAVLLDPLSDPLLAGQRADALKLSKAEKQRLLSIAAAPHTLEAAEDIRAAHRFWHTLGEAGVDVCLLALAAHIGPPDRAVGQDAWLERVEQARRLLEVYYERYEEVVMPPPVIDGRQLIEALQLTPGPVVRELLDYIRQEQAAGVVHNTEDALRVARAFLSRKAP